MVHRAGLYGLETRSTTRSTLHQTIKRVPDESPTLEVPGDQGAASQDNGLARRWQGSIPGDGCSRSRKRRTGARTWNGVGPLGGVRSIGRQACLRRRSTAAVARHNYTNNSGPGRPRIAPTKGRCAVMFRIVDDDAFPYARYARLGRGGRSCACRTGECVKRARGGRRRVLSDVLVAMTLAMVIQSKSGALGSSMAAQAAAARRQLDGGRVLAPTSGVGVASAGDHRLEP